MEWIDKGLAFATRIQGSGLSPSLLWLAGLLFLASLLLSARELLAWYFKSNRILDELARVREDLRALRKEVQATREATAEDHRTSTEALAEEPISHQKPLAFNPSARTSKNFPIH